jgi:subtilase family serine protease
MNIAGLKISRKNIILSTVLFLFLCYSFPLQAEATSAPYTVFKAPYTDIGGAVEWKTDVGIAQSTARANASTGFMGVFGKGFIGGASSEAGLWAKIYVPKDMRLRGIAKIRYMGGISGFGFAECSGFKFKWKVNGKKHEKPMEGGVTKEWVAEKTYEVASLATAMIEIPEGYRTIKNIYDLMDMLDYIQDAQDFILVVNEIATVLDGTKNETISFDFTAKKGWNDIEISVQGGASAVVTGSAMYTIIGYLEELRIDGLGYPDLVVSDWSVTSDESWHAPMPEIGKPAKLRFKIENRGTLESDRTSVDIAIGNQSLSREVPLLKPNGTKEFEFDFMFSQAAVGIKVYVDPKDKIYESDYDWGAAQEKYYERFGIPPGDQNVHLEKGGNLLKLRAIGVEPKSPALPDVTFETLPPSLEIEDGTPTELVVTIVNKGGTDQYNRCQTAEYIEVKVKIPDINWEETKIISSLQSGENKRLTFAIPPITRPQGLPAGSGWGVKVEQIIDPSNRIEERNETNNQSISYIQVYVPTLPQLRIVNFTISPRSASYQEGQSITVRADIEYLGNKPIKDIDVGFYYNKGASSATPDLALIAKKKVTFDKKGIKEVSVVWPVWKSSYIYTDIYSIVDPDNKIAEQDETKSLHSASAGIMVQKKEEEEKPVEGGPLVQGVDLAIEDRDIFLEKQNFMASDYLGVWVHNNGNKSARGQVHFTASWIETDSKGRQRAITQGLCQIGDTIPPASSKLFKMYFKTLSTKGFMVSNHVKLVVDVYPKEDVNPSNNKAVFRIGDFDAVASQLGQTEQQAKEEYFTKPDIAVVNITNTEPPLKVGTKRVFTVVLRNVSQLDTENIEMNCIVRPKGSGRPHPELGWKEFRKVVPKIKAKSNSSLSIDYTPIRKGVYEIVASVGSVKWQGLQTSDADQSNNHMMKYFGIETSVDAETGGEVAPSGVDLDLAATDIWIDNKTPNVGEVISGGFVVHNYSSVALRNVEWKVYSNADEVAAGTITEIGAGASYTVNASSEADQEGTFTIKAIVDPNNKIPETNENNNTITKQLAITSTSQPISLPNVDVAVVSVSLSNAHIKVGQDTKVKAVIQNLGSDTVNAVPVAFLVGDLNFSIQVIDALAPGESKTVTAPLIGLMGGTYTITVIADRRELIKEVNKQNNRGTTTLVVERLIKLQ